MIGLYGLAVWTGLSLGPPIGDALLRASSFEAVWAFAAIAPAIGAAIALLIPETYRPSDEYERGPFIARESIRPGAALSLATVGYAAMASFIVLDLDKQGIGHGAAAFTAFAVTVVATRLVAGNLPDRIGPLRCAAVAALVEAAGLALIALASSLAVAIAGALAMGMAFALIYPSLSLVVVNRVPEERRGAALGTFTAFFDAGIGVGAPVCGVAASLWGYSAAFWLASACALGTAAAAAAGIRERGLRHAARDLTRAADPSRALATAQSACGPQHANRCRALILIAISSFRTDALGPDAQISRRAPPAPTRARAPRPSARPAC